MFLNDRGYRNTYDDYLVPFSLLILMHSRGAFGLLASYKIYYILQYFILSYFMTETIGQAPNMFAQSTPSLFKSITDIQISTLSQSTIRRRFFRKTLENSTSVRTMSIKSSEKSCEKMDVSLFYLKNGSSMVTNDSLVYSKIRNEFHNRGQDPKVKRKREPTPVPGYIGRKKTVGTTEIKKVEIQNDLMIAELQKIIGELKQKTTFYEKRIQINEKQLKQKLYKIIELQNKLTSKVQKQKVLQTKLKSYEDLINKNQIHLKETKCSLEKLKKNIVQNRYSEIQNDNLRLRKENQSLKAINTEFTQQLKNLEIHCKDLEGQLSVLKSISGLSKSFIQSPAEEESQIKIKKEYTIQLQNTISKLQIKIFYLNRKKIQELQKLKQKKNEQISKVRDRLSHINNELKETKKQNQNLRKKLILPERTTIMSCSSWPTQEQISLSLSP